MEEKFAGGKFREIPCTVYIYFAGGTFRAKSKFANIANISSTRKIRVIQYSTFSIVRIGASSSPHPRVRSFGCSLSTRVSFVCFCRASLHLRSDLPVFRFPFTSIFRALHTLHFSLGPTCPNRISIAYLTSSLMFTIPALGLISSVLVFSILLIP